jgi:hypothetical protein
MKRDDYKRVVSQITPDPQFAERLANSARAEKERSSGTFRIHKVGRISLTMGALSICLFVAVAVWFFDITPGDQTPLSKKIMTEQKEENHDFNYNYNQSYNQTKDMVEQLIYGGRIYLPAPIDYDFVTKKSLESILGEKIGRTSTKLDEQEVEFWQRETSKSSEIITNIGEFDVYAVKGYSTDHLLVTFYKENNTENYSFYESLEWLKGLPAAEYLSVYGIPEKLETVQTYNRANNPPLPVDDVRLQTFLEQLAKSFPVKVDRAKWRASPIDSIEQRLAFMQPIDLKLSTGIILETYLYADGHVECGGLTHQSLVYKVDQPTMDAMWAYIEGK